MTVMETTAVTEVIEATETTEVTDTTETIERLEDDICRMIGEIIGSASSHINRNSSWRQLGLDSVQCLEMVMEIEDFFQVVISDEEGESFATVADVVACVAEKKNIKNIAAATETIA